MKDFSFKRGFGQIKQKDIPKVRKELMDALGVNTRMSLSMYMRGLTEPRISQAEAVEKVFANYDITEIWGDE
jgi:hypothetical protein